MRLFRLEIKRILKSRRTLVLLAIAMIFSVLMAIVPILFETINRPNADGTITELSGLQAIEYKQEYYSDFYGEVTQEKVADALRTYQTYIGEYGTMEDMPLDIYLENIFAIRPLLRGLPEAFADSETNMAADLMDINPNEVEHKLYERCSSHLSDVMKLEQGKYPTAQQQAADMYENTTKPFVFYAGLSRDAFDYIELYIFVLGIICVAMIAPIFSGEYQTGSDSILRCTRYGRKKLAFTRILASCTIITAIFALGIIIHLLIINAAFGFEGLKTSIQMLYSIINLPNINLGQLQICLALIGLLSIMAITSCTIFISAKAKDSLTVMSISVVMLLMPAFADAALGANWISCILPSGGIGFQNNFLIQLVNFNYLHIADMSLWTPYVIIVSAVLGIPLFLLLAVRSYCKHQVA